ncbi:MAG: homoserine kinase [Firmicutes bacterium]|nr:homoserine kinase [Bacillota bacterium]
MIKVKVPASSANMGAGFDTLGVALALYNRLEIEETDGGIEIETRNFNGRILQNENNLIYKSMCVVFDAAGYRRRGIRIVQKSDIPMTRGLGSSSACIIGGMLAANVICGRRLSYGEILNLAAKEEGHPDNVAPALYGGFCVSMTDGDITYTKSIKLNSKLKFAVMIPDFYVATKKSRGILPNKVSRADAVFNISRASMFQAALSSGDLDMLKYAARDRLHQPYRKKYIDGMDEIFERTYELGSRATYLSGSGPTIMSLIDRNYRGFQSGMKEFFESGSHKWTCKILSVDNVGTVVSEI